MNKKHYIKSVEDLINKLQEYDGGCIDYTDWYIDNEEIVDGLLDHAKIDIRHGYIEIDVWIEENHYYIETFFRVSDGVDYGGDDISTEHYKGKKAFYKALLSSFKDCIKSINQCSDMIDDSVCKKLDRYADELFDKTYDELNDEEQEELQDHMDGIATFNHMMEDDAFREWFEQHD